MKTFSDFLNEEIAANATSSVATPPTAVFKKKRKNQILTRRYIEVLGKRKKQQV